MAYTVVPCCNCPNEVDTDIRYCDVCGADNRAPNVRVALNEQDLLIENAEAAREDAVRRGITEKVGTLENLVHGASVSINVPIDVVHYLFKSDDAVYAPYLKMTQADVRKKMREVAEHIYRQHVDTILFPNFEDEIIFGALCPRLDGVVSYGACTLLLKDIAVPNRVSLLMDDSYRVIDGCGELGEELPDGYRADWGDRGHLAVFKCEPDLNASTSDEEVLNSLIFSNGDFREDVFIEAHIYGMITK
jgi:hypothetical protein